jgi:hypothetical protein
MHSIADAGNTGLPAICIFISPIYEINDRLFNCMLYYGMSFK